MKEDCGHPLFAPPKESFRRSVKPKQFQSEDFKAKKTEKKRVRSLSTKSASNPCSNGDSKNGSTTPLKGRPSTSSSVEETPKKGKKRGRPSKDESLRGDENKSLSEMELISSKASSTISASSGQQTPKKSIKLKIKPKKVKKEPTSPRKEEETEEDEKVESVTDVEMKSVKEEITSDGLDANGNIHPIPDTLVWAKYGKMKWPARILRPDEMQDRKPFPPSDPERWVKFYGDNMNKEGLSYQVLTKDMQYFHWFEENFKTNFYNRVGRKKIKAYKTSVDEFLVAVAKKLGKKIEDEESMLKWAKGGFSPQNKMDAVPKMTYLEYLAKFYPDYRESEDEESEYSDEESVPSVEDSTDQSTKRSVKNAGKGGAKKGGDGKEKSEDMDVEEEGESDFEDQEEMESVDDSDDSDYGLPKKKRRRTANGGGSRSFGGWQNGEVKQWQLKYKKAKRDDVQLMGDFSQQRKDVFVQVRRDELKLEELCLVCGAFGRNVVNHPFFVGSICTDCQGFYFEKMFLRSYNSYKFCCICLSKTNVYNCTLEHCNRSFCQICIEHMASPAVAKKVMKCVKNNSFKCFLCKDDNCNDLIKKRFGDKTGLAHFVNDNNFLANEHNLDIPRSVVPVEKKPIRVLSLFDGISAGLVALKKLGFKIEIYVASEIDDDANTLVRSHFPDVIQIGDVVKITDKKLAEYGPFDLLIGGSPCNDLSMVNHRRQGIWGGTGQLFFEYVRILNTCKLLASQDNRNFFWLFENVCWMNNHDMYVINRMLGRKGIKLDAVEISPATRARRFWGNIPGMNREMIPFKGDKLTLQECLEKGRVTTVQKTRTITSKSNSVQKGIIQFKDNKSEWLIEDLVRNETGSTLQRLWICEIEKVFGFDPHYTDVADFQQTKRLQLLGKSWSIPVIKHIFSPLCEFFTTERDLLKQGDSPQQD